MLCFILFSTFSFFKFFYVSAQPEWQAHAVFSILVLVSASIHSSVRYKIYEQDISENANFDFDGNWHS